MNAGWLVGLEGEGEMRYLDAEGWRTFLLKEAGRGGGGGFRCVISIWE